MCWCVEGLLRWFHMVVPVTIQDSPLLQRHHEDVTEWLWPLYAAEGTEDAASSHDMHAVFAKPLGEFGGILKCVHLN